MYNLGRNEKAEENFLCILGGIVLAVIFIALMVADGERGLIDFF